MNRKLLSMAIPALLSANSNNPPLEIWRRLNQYEHRYYAFADYPLTNGNFNNER